LPSGTGVEGISKVSPEGAAFGTALVEETNKLIPPRIARADVHDVNAAKQAERLEETERVRSQVDSGKPVIFSGKEAGLYSAPLPELPPLRAGSRISVLSRQMRLE
jgi:hypothetical protein